ncbi:hypothetical protein SMD20_21800 [Nonomuraea sp. LP-02]|uniref:hypothetical protein n=1 Tax=Nonomuraea sp. LP-02 TaxID=3097960 RepID=UPI002E3696DC|nr:hypothetical protein [Nonomuraea sp. LP-02]MED7926905.1 hypothetical protein [Nonomuraea sp. LP-02]
MATDMPATARAACPSAGEMPPDQAEALAEHHHGSHRHLLHIPGERQTDTSVRLDAIIVPTIRNPSQLEPAAQLAAHLGCPLVSIHSHARSRAMDAAALMPPGLQFIAIDIDDTSRLNLPDFATSALLRGTIFQRKDDSSTKRNAGLLLGRLMGWDHVLFLDDDIDVHDHQEISRAVSLLHSYDAIGMRVGGHPDNSVVCHAHRLAGGPQDSFIGGGALATRTSGRSSFFPDIYNDDWFYLLDDRFLCRVAVAGDVSQKPYDPFDRPDRAQDQELGDVLAEGLFWLLDGGGDIACRDVAETAYWSECLLKREAFVRGVLARVRRMPHLPQTDRLAMQLSLVASLDRRRCITAELCASYVRAWRLDRRQWTEHLTLLKSQNSLPAAIEQLTKPGSEPFGYHCQETSNCARRTARQNAAAA